MLKVVNPNAPGQVLLRKIRRAVATGFEVAISLVALYAVIVIMAGLE